MEKCLYTMSRIRNAQLQFTGSNVDLNGIILYNGANPTSSQDLATKNYVDTSTASIDPALSASLYSVSQSNWSDIITGSLVSASLYSVSQSNDIDIRALNTLSSSIQDYVNVSQSVYNWIDTTGSANLPGGSNTYVQYNSASKFAGAVGLRYDDVLLSISDGTSTGSGQSSHAEGYQTVASGPEGSHAEGGLTLSSAQFSHAEGYLTVASGQFSHAEGEDTHAVGEDTHAEGYHSRALGNYSHVEGQLNVIVAQRSHAEGYKNVIGTRYNCIYTDPIIAFTINNTNVSTEFTSGDTLFFVGDDESTHYLTVDSASYNAPNTNVKIQVAIGSTYVGWFLVNLSTSTGINSHIQGVDNSTAAEMSHVAGYGNKLTSTATGSAMIAISGSTGTVAYTLYTNNLNVTGSIINTEFYNVSASLYLVSQSLYLVSQSNDTDIRALTTLSQSIQDYVNVSASLYLVSQSLYTVSSSLYTVSSSFSTRIATASLETLGFAISDETTTLTTGSAKLTFYMPYSLHLNSVRACLTTAGVTSTIIDINQSGSTIMTQPIVIDSGSYTSKTSATASVILNNTLWDNNPITFDIDQCSGSTGAKVFLTGYRI